MSAADRHTLAAGALALAPLLPFLDAAFAIDAPVFLAVARQILASPADPYGFEMVWDPLSPRVAVFDHNPPLLSYYLAPWIAGFGEREAVLHAALLPFPLLASLAFAGLARRWCADSLRPTALLVLSPAFVVLASTLMLDVPMLALQLVAVYALVRALEGVRWRAWAWLAGAAAAAAGLTKYAGLATLPLLAAAVALLPADASGARRRRGVALRTLAPPAVVWLAWALYTRELYGAVHVAGGLALVARRSFAPEAFFGQLLSLPIYYGLALGFPIGLWLARLRRGARGTELAVLGWVAGAAVAAFVLPGGEPPRRAPLAWHAALLASAGFAGACVVWGRALWPPHWRHGPVERFCALWLGGQALFSGLVNWHVGAADALIAAPPALVLVFRDAVLRPAPRAAARLAVASGALALALAAADVAQRDVYREGARQLVREIGAQPGARWFIGHWGFQYYLERESFRAIPPPQHGPGAAAVLAAGDWLASARNVSQLDVSRTLSGLELRAVARWRRDGALPLRTVNADAGAGFYSHRVGYLPFVLGRAPLEEFQLARVRRARRSEPGRAPGARPRALDRYP